MSQYTNDKPWDYGIRESLNCVYSNTTARIVIYYDFRMEGWNISDRGKPRRIQTRNKTHQDPDSIQERQCEQNMKTVTSSFDLIEKKLKIKHKVMGVTCKRQRMEGLGIENIVEFWLCASYEAFVLTLWGTFCLYFINEVSKFEES